VLFHLEKAVRSPGDRVLEIENLAADNDKGLPALRGLSLHVCAGEIVGLAGVAGNGQAELAEVVTGLRPPTGGSVRVHGELLVGRGARFAGTSEGVRRILDAGVSHIPEDRTHVGTAPNLSITDNVIMKGYRKPPLSRGWSIDRVEAKGKANALRSDYDIMVPTVETPARLLSGGNLQRLILAREISSQPRLMIAMQPTRGLDVGAIESVQRLLLQQRVSGAAILLVTEELDELIAMSDRVYAIYAGEIMGEMSRPDIQSLGLMMTGMRQADLPPAEERIG
jgi:simple sugar transport system ATP-binding protein